LGHVHHQLLFICDGFALVFVADSVWWLVAGGCLKEVSSMKQKIHALTNRKRKKVGNGHRSFSMRSAPSSGIR
jgi:hypothetical protein